MSYNFLYNPLSLFQFSIKLHQHIAFRYSFKINIVSMRQTTCFETPQPLIYHLCTALKPILCILCHITSYTSPWQPHSISIKLHQHIVFRYSFKINIVSMRQTTCFNTPQSLIYHLSTALKPLLCILCHITSYTTSSASFNFDQTSSIYCF